LSYSPGSEFPVKSFDQLRGIASASILLFNY